MSKLGETRRVSVHARHLPRRCTSASCGRCGSTPASARPPRPTSASGTCSSRGPDRPLGGARPADAARAGLGRPRGRAARWARSAWPSIRWPTWRRIFEGIPLDQVSTSFTINATAHDPARDVRGGRARSRASPQERIAGTMQNDLLKEFGARGAWIFPIEPSMRLVVDVIEDCTARAAALQPHLDRLALPRRRRHASRGDGLHALRRRRLRRGAASSAA